MDKKKVNLKKQLEECQKERVEYLEGWQRAKADFLNYKRDEIQRIKNLASYEKQELICRLLPVLDNFEKAEKETPSRIKKDNHFQGFLKIKAHLESFLTSQGIKKLDSQGKEFDPNFHEVLEMVEVKGRKSGIIIEEVEKGYLMEGKLIRPAKVKVTK